MAINWIQVVIAFILGVVLGPKVHSLMATKKL